MDIRPAKPEDIEQIMELCAAHAQYEGYSFQKAGKAKALSHHLFEEQSSILCLVVADNQRLFGYATFMKQFSTWEAVHYLYLDCLYLKEEVRGKGIGREIMNEIKNIAKKEGCGWMEWQTPSFNQGAIRFYRNLGAVSKAKERFFWEV